MLRKAGRWETVEPNTKQLPSVPLLDSPVIRVADRIPKNTAPDCGHHQWKGVIFVEAWQQKHKAAESAHFPLLCFLFLNQPARQRPGRNVRACASAQGSQSVGMQLVLSAVLGVVVVAVLVLDRWSALARTVATLQAPCIAQVMQCLTVHGLWHQRRNIVHTSCSANQQAQQNKQQQNSRRHMIDSIASCKAKQHWQPQIRNG
jgi:hypothetical protein